MAILRLLNETIVILSNMGTYISIKSTVNAFRYGIDPVPEWFDKISNKTDEVDVMVEGNRKWYSTGFLRLLYRYVPR